MNQNGFAASLVLIAILTVFVAGGIAWVHYYSPSNVNLQNNVGLQPASNSIVPSVAAPSSTSLNASPLNKQQVTSQEQQSSETSAKSQFAAFQLQSEFLKNDPTAQKIASGQINNYDIRTYPAIYGNKGPYSTDNFAYKFLSSLRMLGYIRGNKTASGMYVAEQYLNGVQRFNDLALSPFIDGSILKIIDSKLAEKENLDRNLALKFPLYDHLIDPPLNEPTKEHVAALLAAIFNELPVNLAAWNETNFKDFYAQQFGAGARIKNINSSDYQICETAIYSEFGINCVIGIYFGTPLINKAPDNSPNFDDFSYASLVLHEYAHYLDQKLYSPESGTSKGVIDTAGFYNISYDTSDPAPGGVREFAYRRPQNVKNEFVSAYAQGWKRTVSGKDYFSAAEDFAESFSLYITDGKVFRKLAESNDILKQKYDWLKINVFNGQEYQSGDTQGIAVIKQQPNTDIATQSTGAFNVVDYSTSLPNFVWNYHFLNGSMATR